MSCKVIVLICICFIQTCFSIPCSTKKGLVFNSGTYCGVAGQANAGHFVNFRVRPVPCFGVSKMHFPTIWKAADVADLDAYLGSLAANDRPEWVLGYNEPNFAYGGDHNNIISPENAAIEWKHVIDLKNKYHFKLTSPSPIPADVGLGPERYTWFQRWFDACKKHGYDCLESIDAFGVHSYEGWDEFSQTPKKLQEKFHTNKPTFYSEVCQGHNAGVDKQIAYMTRIFTEGEKMSDIVKIFWNTAEPIPGDENVLGSEIFTRHTGGELDGKIGTITRTGELFKSINNC